MHFRKNIVYRIGYYPQYQGIHWGEVDLEPPTQIIGTIV